MQYKIVDNTDIKLASVRQSLIPSTNKSSYRDTDILEINALIGLFLFSSILKSNDEDIASMFSSDATVRPIYQATTTKKKVLYSYSLFEV